MKPVFLEELIDRFEARALRERVLIAGTVVVATGMLWLVMVSDHLSASISESSSRIASLSSQIEQEIREQAAIRNGSGDDPSRQLENERAKLIQELDAFATVLDRTLSDFVPPDRMAVLLEDLIKRHDGLTLVRMANVPAEPLRLGEGAHAPVVPGMYRHAMDLEFEGGYFDVVDYLAELENMPWEFGWRRLDYEVINYPLARVTLRIETLSRETSLIGV